LSIGLPVLIWRSSIFTTARHSRPDIVVMGKVDSGVETFSAPGSLKVTIDLAG
jgi:hypothetical protein